MARVPMCKQSAINAWSRHEAICPNIFLKLKRIGRATFARDHEIHLHSHRQSHLSVRRSEVRAAEIVHQLRPQVAPFLPQILIFFSPLQSPSSWPQPNLPFVRPGHLDRHSTRRSWFSKQVATNELQSCSENCGMKGFVNCSKSNILPGAEQDIRTFEETCQRHPKTVQYKKTSRMKESWMGQMDKLCFPLFRR